MKKLILTLLLFGLAQSAWAAVENPTSDYTEVDPTSAITLDANTASCTNLDSTSASYVYKDHSGTADFGDGLDIDFKHYMGATGSGAALVILGLSNGSVYTYDDMDTANSGVVFFYDRNGTDRYELRDHSTGQSATEAGDGDQQYETRYSTITRSGTTLTVKMYSDSNRTTQVGSDLSITCEDTTWDNLIILASPEQSWRTGHDCDGYCEDITINTYSGSPAASVGKVIIIGD